MDLDIRSRRVRLDPALRRYISRRAYFALSRFSDRLGRVVVRVADVNGPRGGVDKLCRATLEMRGNARLLKVETTCPDLRAAIDRTLERAGHLVGREQARVRHEARSRWVGWVPSSEAP